MLEECPRKREFTVGFSESRLALLIILSHAIRTRYIRLSIRFAQFLHHPGHFIHEFDRGDERRERNFHRA